MTTEEPLHPAAQAVVDRILGVQIVIVDKNCIELSNRLRVPSIPMNGTDIGGMTFDIIHPGFVYGIRIIGGGPAEGVHEIAFSNREVVVGSKATINTLQFTLD